MKRKWIWLLDGCAGHVTLSASTIFMRAARIAGNTPPTKPMIRAKMGAGHSFSTVIHYGYWVTLFLFKLIAILGNLDICNHV